MGRKTDPDFDLSQPGPYVLTFLRRGAPFHDLDRPFPQTPEEAISRRDHLRQRPDVEDVQCQTLEEYKQLEEDAR